MPDLYTWEQKFIQTFGLDKEGLVADFDERRLGIAEKDPLTRRGRSRVSQLHFGGFRTTVPRKLQASANLPLPRSSI
jgi:hypothetical protein